VELIRDKRFEKHLSVFFLSVVSEHITQVGQLPVRIAADVYSFTFTVLHCALCTSASDSETDVQQDITRPPMTKLNLFCM